MAKRIVLLLMAAVEMGVRLAVRSAALGRAVHQVAVVAAFLERVATAFLMVEVEVVVRKALAETAVQMAVAGAAVTEEKGVTEAISEAELAGERTQMAAMAVRSVAVQARAIMVRRVQAASAPEAVVHMETEGMAVAAWGARSSFVREVH